MGTRSRAWSIRAAVFALVAAAGVMGIATPAQADPAADELALNPQVISAGGTAQLRFQLNSGGGATTGSASYNLEFEQGGPDGPPTDQLECTAGCSGVVKFGVEKTAQIRTKRGVYFSSDQQFTVTLVAKCSPDNCGTARLPIGLTVQATQSVPEVSGTVTNLFTGDPISSAQITMTDSVGTTWDGVATTDDGAFSILSTSDKPIAAGELNLTASKDGFDDFPKKVTGNPGQPLSNVRLTMSPNTTPSAGSSAPPITASIDVNSSTVVAAPPPPSGGLSGFSLTLIIVGGLLVLLGIGAIVLLFIRRGDGAGGPPKGPKGRGGPGRGGPPGRTPPPGPRRPGMPDRTGPIRPGYGPPRPGAPGRDQTQIARSPLADNPTQTRPRSPGQPPHSGPPTSYPPPGGGYGPPYPPQQGGYGQSGYGPQSGYGQQHTQGGGQQTYGGDPRRGGGPRPRGGEGRRVDWLDD
ncbi:MAG TPA: carboxypeptidase-like regulatory domain-containing protein [Micromonosporaceae bacterium]|jgi:hypothetical protein